MLDEKKTEATFPPIHARRPSWYLEHRGWSREAAVRNKERQPVQLNEPRQASYCMYGAIRIAEYNKGITSLSVALLRTALVHLIGGKAESRKDEIACIVHWNDKECSFTRAAVDLMKVAERLTLDDASYADTLDWAEKQGISFECQERLRRLLEQEEAEETELIEA